MMREKAEGIERARAGDETKVRAEDDMRKKVLREKSLGLRNSKRQWGSSLRRKSQSVSLN